MSNDFYNFLMTKYSNLVRYTENDTPNEDLWLDKFNDWLCELPPDDFIKYGNEFANQLTINHGG